MSIATELNNYRNGLEDAWDAAEYMGATIPSDRNMNNLDTAIRTIPQPVVNDGTLTIQKNGTAVGTFTANQAGNTTANITVPTDTSDLTNGAGFITSASLPTKTSDLQNDGSDGTSTYVEADDLATVATSGSYTDLSNKPTIPTVNDSTITIQKNSTTVDSFTTNAASDKTINITVPTTAADVSALPDSTKYGASFTMSINSSTYVVTATLKDQDGNTLGSAQTIDLPLESVVVNGSYDDATKKIILTLQNGNTIEFSVADLVSGLQTEITSNSPLDADLVDDSTSTNKFVTSSDITTWNGKQDALTAGTNIQINGTTISATDTTYSAMAGATSGAAGTSGLVPAPAAGDNTKALYGDGTWKLPGMTILKYGTSTYAEALAAYQANNIIYTRASSNASNPGTGDQLRMAFLAYVNNEATPTEFEFQYYRSVATHSDSTQGDEVFIYKLKQATGWEFTKRNAYSKVAVDSSLTKTYSSGTITLKANAMTGASSGTAGTAGYVPQPAAGDDVKYLKGDGTWAALPSANNINSTDWNALWQ